MHLRRTFEILALSGSLRAASVNSMALEAAYRVALEAWPRRELIVNLYQKLGELPLFNPDLEGKITSRALKEFRQAVRRADALLIACPEYARGIPGAFKNALDWLVGGSEIPGKPIALINCAVRASEAQASLRLVLKTMSTRVIEEACITLDLLGKELSAQAIAQTAEHRDQLLSLLKHLKTCAKEENVDA